MTGESLQRLLRLLRAYELHQFHFFELVLADHAAGVPAIAAGFTAEARGMAGEAQPLLAQFGVLEDSLARDIGHRHLGRGDQVKILLAAQLEQVLLELG